MTCRVYNAVTGEFGVLRSKSLQGFIDTIHERTPNGEPILVQHHPNGDWSVANSCGQSSDALEGLLWESIEDHRAVISVLLEALEESMRFIARYTSGRGTDDLLAKGHAAVTKVKGGEE